MSVKRWMIALLLLMAMAGGASAQTELEVYAADGALSAARAQQLARLMGQALPEAAFTLLLESETGENLRDLVLADRAPDIALCTPEEAVIWAREGLLLPLEGAITGGETIAPEALDACVYEESAFMAPLFASHRLMAVNRRMMEAIGLDQMLSREDYPVWLPMQMQQVLEEFAISGIPAMDVWPPDEEGAGVLALVQAMYSAPLGEMGQLTNSGALQAGIAWLDEMASCELIGVAESREEALSRFMAGETAMFCDFTAEDAAALSARERSGDVALMPHPSSSGLPVRAFTVTGAAVFKTGDEAHDRLAFEAVSFLAGDTRVGDVLGGRAIGRDDALWLPRMGVSARGSAIERAFAKALCAVLRDEMDAQEAAGMVEAAAQAFMP